MDSHVFLSRRDGVILVQLTGRAGVEAAAQLHEQLLQVNINQPIVVDWGQTEHIEACVLQVLLACRRGAEGQSLSVESDNIRVREYLKLSGLSEHFPATARISPSDSRGAVDA